MKINWIIILLLILGCMNMGKIYHENEVDKPMNIEKAILHLNKVGYNLTKDYGIQPYNDSMTLDEMHEQRKTNSNNILISTSVYLIFNLGEWAIVHGYQNNNINYMFLIYIVYIIIIFKFMPIIIFILANIYLLYKGITKVKYLVRKRK